MSLEGLNARIRQVREARGLNQKEFAGKLGIHVNTQANYEKGERVPDAAYLVAVCEAFGLSADVLLGLSEEQRARLAVPLYGLNPRPGAPDVEGGPEGALALPIELVEHEIGTEGRRLMAVVIRPGMGGGFLDRGDLAIVDRADLMATAGLFLVKLGPQILLGRLELTSPSSAQLRSADESFAPIEIDLVSPARNPGFIGRMVASFRWT